ncbi:MAG: hypothetical protein WCB70_00230 [Xanthobacteraceae bacterium]
MAINIARRKCIVALGGAVLPWPLVVHAQQPARLPTIGFLGAGTPSAWSRWTPVFVQRLHELGWIEGRTVTIEYRYGKGLMTEGWQVPAALLEKAGERFGGLRRDHNDLGVRAALHRASKRYRRKICRRDDVVFDCAQRVPFHDNKWLGLTQ